MDATERKITVLQAWAKDRRGGLEIKFTGHNPTIIDEIPHPWTCTFGTKSEKYTGYGTTMNNAIDNVYKEWQSS